MAVLMRYPLSFSFDDRLSRRGVKARGCKHVGLFYCVKTEESRCIVVKNGNDSLEICRVVNGMWQTSGGWGRIDRDNAVDDMIKYADAGLTTFDMADICMGLPQIKIYCFSLFPSF